MDAVRRAFSLAPDPDAVVRVMLEVTAFLRDRLVPDSAVERLMLALDELLTNTIRHGGLGGTDRWIDLSVEIGAEVVTIDLIDDGTPFDPTRQAPPNLELALEDRPIGGLGIHLVRQFMDRFEYDRIDQRNRVRIAKRYRP